MRRACVLWLSPLVAAAAAADDPWCGQAIGARSGTLLPPHRLDAGTEGVVVMAKNTPWARRFKEIFEDKEAVRGNSPPAAPASACARALCVLSLLWHMWRRRERRHQRRQHVHDSGTPGLCA